MVCRMGEVRIEVKLTNAVDLALARRGHGEPAQARSCVAEAMVDTGAVRCVIPQHVADKLGAQTLRRKVVPYADGREEAVLISEPILFEIMTREEEETAFILGDEVLIGQTLLEKMDLHVDWLNRRLVSNPAHPDQPINKLK